MNWKKATGVLALAGIFIAGCARDNGQQNVNATQPNQPLLTPAPAATPATTAPGTHRIAPAAPGEAASPVLQQREAAAVSRSTSNDDRPRLVETTRSKKKEPID